ncbi:glycosyltransferase [Nostoc sp. FACHB-190]|uniref:glycosyltransferase n=1 Tax=Nostoc sp. FACHB-190 TaxID=2692838 RepID=UPI001688C7EE|nr:glycosyltransferase [Nostoc sp. FACHB-190]MBD2297301.1 glycosyltransferase family 2 protein [Nostoc sp. FACHB-190]
MNNRISLIICTHNPRKDYLDRVINSLKIQTLPMTEWEFLLIDNASDRTLAKEIDITWHPNARHIREDNLGLTAARLRAFKEASNEILVFVDDDNVLDANYLKNTSEIVQGNPHLGAIGGKSLPEFEIEPESWINQFSVCLALRNLGDEPLIYFAKKTDCSSAQYPPFAPIGAGLVLRRKAAQVYAQNVSQDSSRLALGRTGKQLISGEDNDINLTILEAGWGVGYFPQLQLTHLISANRLSKDYLARLNRASSRSWVQVLDAHNIRPWQKIPSWTVVPRKLKAFLSYQPWKSPANYVSWQGACGIFEGLSTLSSQ